MIHDHDHKWPGMEEDDDPNWARTPSGGWVRRNPLPPGFHTGNPPAKVEPPKPLDPAILKAVTDFGIYEGPDTLTAITKPRTYLMSEGGLRLVSKGLLGTFVAKVDGVPGLAKLEPGLTLDVPKLPWDHLRDTVAFFRYVNTKWKAEAMVQFFWDLEGKTYLAVCPDQVVSGGGIHHFGDFDAANTGRYTHLLDIHSHHTMGAFWSSTDDNDEKRFENRLFGVIGKIDQKVPEMNWRARVGGTFVNLRTEEVVELPPPSDILVKVSIGGVLDAKGGGVNYKLDLDPFEGATFPEEWLKHLREGFPAHSPHQPHSPRGGQRHLPGGGATTEVRALPHYIFDRGSQKVYIEDAITKDLFPSVFTSPEDISARWGKVAITTVDHINPAKVRGFDPRGSERRAH
jgi:hypothetical protein